MTTKKTPRGEYYRTFYWAKYWGVWLSVWADNAASCWRCKLGIFGHPYCIRHQAELDRLKILINARVEL